MINNPRDFSLTRCQIRVVDAPRRTFLGAVGRKRPLLAGWFGPRSWPLASVMNQDRQVAEAHLCSARRIVKWPVVVMGHSSSPGSRWARCSFLLFDQLHFGTGNLGFGWTHRNNSNANLRNVKKDIGTWRNYSSCIYVLIRKV